MLAARLMAPPSVEFPSLRAGATLILTVLALPIVAGGQSRAPVAGGDTPSIGQPSAWRWSAGTAVAGARSAGESVVVGELRGALSRDLGHPLMGVGSFQLEPYLSSAGGAPTSGVRARLTVPFLQTGVGVQQRFTGASPDWFITAFHPIRRGGVFHDGSVLRFDFSPGRDGSIAIGLEKPIQRRVDPGKSRPGRDYVRLSGTRVPPTPVPQTTEVQQALRDVRDRAVWIGTLTVPWLDHPSGNRARSETAVLAKIAQLKRDLTTVDDAGKATPRLMDNEVRRYHEAVDRAFSGALRAALPTAGEAAIGAQAKAVADRARNIVLDEVLLPYDRLLGQVKEVDSTNEFARAARGIFLHWLYVDSDVPREAMEGVLGVFIAVLDLIEENRARIKAEWGDSRFVWLPLQYALRPEEHDTQPELDAIVERAIGERFSGGNRVSYVINEQAQYQFSRMIHAAREYHVLWIHDFRGTDDQGDIDQQSYRHVLASYLRAMTDRVREYDSTGTFPTYVILIDQWFYAFRGARLWMTLLEDPMNHDIQLPRAFRGWEDSLQAAQAALREAVAQSRLLQAQRAQWGDEWLRSLVKVQVNVTNSAEWSFQSRRLAPPVAIGDNILRDHRKISFYDVSEDDPNRGEAMFTGAGVGENYSNLSWEDRSLLVRGPAALHLKEVARQVLLDQGIDSTRIPWVLRARPMAADYDAKVLAQAADARGAHRAIGIHNATGYGAKDLNVAKAVLYTLMPPGSVIKVPDSLWNASFWGAALAGCALRGGRVIIIAPAHANSPVPAFGSAEHAYELMWRTVAVARELEPELKARGGVLRLGIFASTIAVTDVPGKLKAAQKTFAEQPWLRELFGFPPSVYQGLGELVTAFAGVAVPTVPNDFESEPVPSLHLKANLIFSREAWSLMARPEWSNMTWEFSQQRLAQVQMRTAAVEDFTEHPDVMLEVGDAPIRAWFDALSPADRERVVFYTMIGSQNHNFRSMVTDGEVALVVSGWPSVIPVLDLIALIGVSHWPTDVSEIAALHPPRGRVQTRMGHWLRLVF